MAQSEIDAGGRGGLSSDERNQLAVLRKENRRLEIENEILRRAVLFARENAGLEGVYRHLQTGCTVRDPEATPSAALVNRRFRTERPDALWVCDVTHHRTGGWVYCAVVPDVIGRGQTVVDSDHGAQYTSWAFGHRLREAGLLASMGSIGDCYDDSMVESFFGSIQLELLNRQSWTSRQELVNAIVEWIEAFYNPMTVRIGRPHHIGHATGAISRGLGSPPMVTGHSPQAAQQLECFDERDRR